MVPIPFGVRDGWRTSDGTHRKRIDPWRGLSTRAAGRNDNGRQHVRVLGRSGSPRTNRPRKRSWEMIERKPAATGPMSTQPAQHAAISSSLPFMPASGREPKVSEPQKRPTRMHAVGKAKARMMRRASLRKQREDQKARPR